MTRELFFVFFPGLFLGQLPGSLLGSNQVVGIMCEMYPERIKEYFPLALWVNH